MIHHQPTTNRARLIIMSGVLLALLLSALDQTIVSTAMPRIIASLGGLNYYSWVFTSYLLTSTAAMPVFGKLSDLYGRRRFMIGGTALFLVSSGLCGLAQSMPELIVLRGIQGIGGGIMMVNAFSIVGDVFPPAERGKWQGLTSSAFALASVLGPALGGYLTDNFTWRWVFYVNLPIGAVALAVIAVTLPEHSGSGRRYAIDYLGVTTLVLALVPLLLAFVWAGDLFPWISLPFFALLGLALVAGGFFLWIEEHAAEPIMPLHLFRNRIYSAGGAVMFLSGMAIFGAIVYIPLYMVAVRGSSATGAGLATIPMSVAMPISSTAAGLLVARTGRYRIQTILAGLVMAAGFFLLASMTLSTSTPTLYAYMIVVGVGTGALMPIVTIAVQNAVSYEFLGIATSAVQFFRSIGQTVGVAIFGSVLTTRLAVEIPRQLTGDLTSGLSPAANTLVRNPKTWLDPVLPSQLQQELTQSTIHGHSLLIEVTNALRDAFAASLHDVFLIGGVLSIVAIIATLTLREVPLRKSNLEGVLSAGHGEGFTPDHAAPSLALAGDEGGD